jgi:hypothetical protein
LIEALDPVWFSALHEGLRQVQALAMRNIRTISTGWAELEVGVNVRRVFTIGGTRASRWMMR